MLRIATLAILAISVPAYAQSRRAGPGNLDQKLNQILERLERLEQRVEKSEERRERRPDAQRRRPQRERDAHDGPRDRRDMRDRPGRDGPRGRPDRQDGARRGPQNRGPGGPAMGNQPFGRLPQIIQAARRGDPRAKQMLTRVRKAIDDALGGKPHPSAKAGGVFRLGKMGGEPDLAKKKMLARRKAEAKKAHAEMTRRIKAHEHYKKLEKAEKAKLGKTRDEDARMKKLLKESKRLQEEIRRLRAELAEQR